MTGEFRRFFVQLTFTGWRSIAQLSVALLLQHRICLCDAQVRVQLYLP